MAGYVNLHAGVGKPLWEITLGEYAVWFKVCCALCPKVATHVGSRRNGLTEL